MNYSKANINQIEEVFSVYSAAIKHMEKQEIHQWDEIYPDLPTITEDIKKNQMYLGIIDNKISVCFVLSEECDEEYKNGKWNYPDSKFCVIHILSIWWIIRRHLCKSRISKPGYCLQNPGKY